MQASRMQVLLTVLAGIFLLATVSIFAVFAVAPGTAVVYRPLLLSAFVVTIFISLVSIAWLLRGLLRPYSQLIGEARRAPVAHSGKTQNEAAFVLETFQSVIAQLQDQQKELQRLTEHASQRADSAERFSDRIVASMPTGLIAFDARGNVTVMNGPAQALFQAGTGSRPHYRSVLGDVPDLANMIQDCLATGRLFRREEIITTRPSEGTARLGATVAPMDATSDGGARGALCLITDITEVTRLREQVALKRNLESLGEMSAGLAHEFKNAMATLHGYAQFLQSIDHDQRGQAAADALLQEVRNLSEMTTAFLNFARPRALQLEDVSLDELIQECVRELTPLFEARKVELIVSPAARTSGLEIQADLRMFRQALLNLLRNGAEAIPEEQNDRRVIIDAEVEKQKGKRWATISIRDSGSGIPPSDLQKIFIPFFTTKSHGHGVGLALAHRVITEHGGTLLATNAAEGGAAFIVRIRVIDAPGKHGSGGL
jgi:signal transduction histidine kinase